MITMLPSWSSCQSLRAAPKITAPFGDLIPSGTRIFAWVVPRLVRIVSCRWPRRIKPRSGVATAVGHTMADISSAELLAWRINTLSSLWVVRCISGVYNPSLLVWRCAHQVLPVAAFTCTVWDHIITFSDEVRTQRVLDTFCDVYVAYMQVRYIWKGRKSFRK